MVKQVHLEHPGYTTPAEVRAGLLEASTLLADVASLPPPAVAVLSLLFSKLLTVDLGVSVLRSAAGEDIVAYAPPDLAQRAQQVIQTVNAGALP